MHSQAARLKRELERVTEERDGAREDWARAEQSRLQGEQELKVGAGRRMRGSPAQSFVRCLRGRLVSYIPYRGGRSLAGATCKACYHTSRAVGQGCGEAMHDYTYPLLRLLVATSAT